MSINTDTLTDDEKHLMEIVGESLPSAAKWAEYVDVIFPAGDPT